MAYQGIDTVASISKKSAQTLKKEGISFVGRYLVPSGCGKEITATEIQTLHDAGLAILLCWELTASAVKNGAVSGTKDAARARALAEGFGVPAGTTIFFACDYNIPQSDLIQCEQYILAAKAAIGSYNVGLYGPEKIVAFLSERGSCKKFWQCVAWSAKFLPAANVQQYQWQGGADAKALAKKLGFDVDLDRCDNLRTAGLWLPPYAEYQEDDGSTIYEPQNGTTQSPWYSEVMAWAEQEGLIKDGRPNDTMTRAEVATVFKRFNALVDDKIAKALSQNNK